MTTPTPPPFDVEAARKTAESFMQDLAPVDKFFWKVGMTIRKGCNEIEALRAKLAEAEKDRDEVDAHRNRLDAVLREAEEQLASYRLLEAGHGSRLDFINRAKLSIANSESRASVAEAAAEELRRELAETKRLLEHGRDCHVQTAKERDRYREALEWYAQEGYYGMTSFRTAAPLQDLSGPPRNIVVEGNPIMHDRGRNARSALSAAKPAEAPEEGTT